MMTGNVDHLLFIVDGQEILNTKTSDYQFLLREWDRECSYILNSFTTKTSRVATDLAKNNFKEYTYWYQQMPSGGLKSRGKERPDIESMYPPKPEHPVTFEYQAIDHRHIIISEDDYKNNSELFGLDCFVFPYSALISLCSSEEAECP
jgi:hypothetical protein